MKDVLQKYFSGRTNFEKYTEPMKENPTVTMCFYYPKDLEMKFGEEAFSQMSEKLKLGILICKILLF